MEIKLKFRDFVKVRLLKDTNATGGFTELVKYIEEIYAPRTYSLYWKDNENDFILIDDVDGFEIATRINSERLTIYICSLGHVNQEECCASCSGRLLKYWLHCLDCQGVVLCGDCAKLHQRQEGHFSILEKAPSYQIHPFLYKQLERLVEREAIKKNLEDICSFFQKVVGKYGVSVSECLNSSLENKLFKKRSSDLEGIISNYNRCSQDTIFPGSSFGDSDSEDIDVALNKMINMGFINTDNCIRNLLLSFNGNIPKTLDYMSRNMVIH